MLDKKEITGTRRIPCRTIVLRCIGSFLLGIALLYIMFSCESISKFLQSISIFFAKVFGDSFSFFFNPGYIALVIVGTVCGLAYSEKAWLYSIFIAFPMFFMFGPLNFGDASFILRISFGLGFICSACVGAYIGSRIVFKFG